jgi:hypothetical protein
MTAMWYPVGHLRSIDSLAPESDANLSRNA